MPLTLAQIPDFVESVLNKYVRDKYTDFTLNPRFKVAPKIFEKDAGLNWSSGEKCEFKIRIATDGNARVTGLYDRDRSNINSQLSHGRVPWAMYTTNFSFDRQEEVFMSDNGQRIIDYIKVRDHGMYEDMWELWEEHLWTEAASSSSSPLPLYGIPLWVQKNGAVAGGARNGGNPSGFASGIGEINSSTYERWNNWTFAHDGTITRDGFIKRVVKAAKFCRFEAAHAYPAAVAPNKDDRFGFYTTYLMWEQLGDFVRAQNDNLGKDGAAMYDGTPTIMGNSVMEVPYLTANNTGTGDGNDPFYGINWQSMGFQKRRGWFLNRSKPTQSADSHNVFTVHADTHIASCCRDRSANFVGHRVA